jgi:O-antigen/teichoic acid export membrane protein
MASALAGHQLISLGGALPVYVLPLLVATLMSPTDNAYFYTAWMVTNALLMVPAALSYSLFAEGSHAPQELEHQVRVSLVACALLLGPLILLLLVAGRVVVTAFGPGYADHVPPLLTLLVLSTIPRVGSSVYISALRVRERLRFAAALSVGTAACTLGLAWALIETGGLRGAGWAVLVAEVVQLAVVAVDLARRRRPARHGRCADEAAAAAGSGS